MTPATASRSVKKVMNREEVMKLLSALDLRERLITKLAVFAGMRPGEILGLKWQHVREDCVVIE